MFKNLFKNKTILIQTIFIIAFILTLFLLTYFLTTQALNPYIVPFKRTFKSEFTSIIGNITVLSMVCLIVFIFIKRPYRRIYTLGIIEIVLAFILYFLRIYARSYFAFFSFREMTIMKNPAGKLGLNLTKQMLGEFFTTGMFLTLVPGIIFIIIALVYRKNPLFYEKRESHTTNKKVAASILTLSLSFAMVLSFRASVKKKWPYNSDLSLYGCMNCGLYNYYLYEALGWDFHYNGKNYSNEDITVEINKYDRNSSTYTNFLDNNNSDERVYVGSLAGKNIKIIQLESVNKYCVDLKLKNGELLMPNFNKILSDSNAYYCTNFYTSSGQGKTADAEFAINTGVNPQGPNTQHWEYKNNNYEFQTIAKMFKEKYDATCYSFHGDLAKFYNRNHVHTEMFGYDKYYSLEEYLLTHKDEKEDPNSFINGWVDDHVVLEWEDEVSSKIDGSFLTYQIMTVSHTPFAGNPKEDEYDFGYKNKMLYRYIAYMRYVDDYLDELYEKMKNDTNTIYIIYGDHGSFLTKKEQKELFGKQSTLDFELNNTKVPCVIFDASKTLNTLTENNMRCNMLRSEIDIFTTIVDLFDLDYKGVRLGVNIFSKEKTFTYDPNTFTIITDDYIYYTKNDKKMLFNPISDETLKHQIELIKHYKVIVDIANKRNMIKKEAK